MREVSGELKVRAPVLLLGLATPIASRVSMAGVLSELWEARAVARLFDAFVPDEAFVGGAPLGPRGGSSQSTPRRFAASSGVSSANRRMG